MTTRSNGVNRTGLTLIGLLLAAAGSAVYHWAPDPLGLALDRVAGFYGLG